MQLIEECKKKLQPRLGQLEAVAGQAYVFHCEPGQPWHCLVVSQGDTEKSVGNEEAGLFGAYALQLERAKWPAQERKCTFCQHSVTLDEEYFARIICPFGSRDIARPRIYILVCVFFCGRAPCATEKKDAWLAPVRDLAGKVGVTRICEHCGKRSDTIKYKSCGHCNFVNYCSEECQQAAWPNHKLFCATCI